MAEEIKFKVGVDADKATQAINGLVTTLGELTKTLKTAFGQADKEMDDAADAVKEVGKEIKKTEKQSSGLKSIFAGGFGLGAGMKIFDSFTSALMENQKVQNLMNQGQVVFQGLLNALVNKLEPVVKWLGKAFKEPQEWIKDLGNMLYNQVINRLNGLLELLPALGDAFVQLFSGNFEEAGKIAVNALGKVALGVEDVYGKASDFISDVAEETKKAFDASEYLAKAEVNIRKLEIAYQGIIEKYDRMAETQRQLRDDEEATIEERIAANEKLGEILLEQSKEEKDNINARIAILQTQQRILGKTTERELEILDLKKEISAVDAKIVGFQSEQLVNLNSLNKERAEIAKSAKETQIELLNGEMEMALLSADTEEKKFEIQKQYAQMRWELQQEMLSEEIAAHKEGTAFYQDAVNEKIKAEQEYAIEIAQIEADTAAYKKEQAEKTAEQQKADAEALEEQRKKDLEDAQAKAEANYQIAMDASNQLKGLIGEDTKAGMAISLAQAIADTYTGASKALAQGGIFGPIAAAGIVAAGMANVAKIREQARKVGVDLSSDMGSMGGVSFGPSIGLVGGQIDNQTQLMAAMEGSMGKPAKAYVVGTDMSSQQALDRRTRQNATLGG